MKRYILINLAAAILLTFLAAILAHQSGVETTRLSACLCGSYVAFCIAIIILSYAGAFKTDNHSVSNRIRRLGYLIIILPAAIELALVHEYLNDSIIAYSLISMVNGIILLLLEVKASDNGKS